MVISEEVVNSFNLTGELIPLHGGQNTSVRVGHAVLKPVDDVLYYEWVLNIIDTINPQGYRLSKPIRSNNGTFVSEGYICTRFEPGHEANGRIRDKLEVSRLFHSDISNIDFRGYSQVDSPWTKAHRIAWQIDELPMNFQNEIRRSIYDLLVKVNLKKQYNLQFVHADLSGNILFDKELLPLLIDFSPTVAPVEYAEAILVCDCIAWQGSNINEIDVLPKNDLYKEMIIRAIVFRLAVEAILSGADFKRFNSQYHLFKPIIEYIE